MKKIHLFSTWSLIFSTLFITVTLSYDKRDYTNRQYYTLHTTQPIDIQAVKSVAHTLGARYEGQVGELNQYHWISIPMSPITLSKRYNQEDPLIQQFHHHRGLQKRDFEWNFVDQIQAQVPTKRLYKRAPPPVIENKEEEYKLNDDTPPPIELPSLSDTDGYERIKDLLNIHDPGFDQQWHLVRIYYIFIYKVLCLFIYKNLIRLIGRNVDMMSMLLVFGVRVLQVKML
jgi:kexin